MILSDDIFYVWFDCNICLANVNCRIRCKYFIFQTLPHLLFLENLVLNMNIVKISDMSSRPGKKFVATKKVLMANEKRVLMANERKFGQAFIK